MNWTKFLIATLIGGIAYFLLGWLFYGILLKDAMALPANLQELVVYPEEEFKISMMFGSCLVWGALFSLILMRWTNVSTFMGGFKAGAIIAALITLSSGLGLASQFRIWSIDTVMIDVVVNTISTGIIGGLIGWYLGRGKH